MIKNIAGQTVGAQMITTADGTDFTGSVSVFIVRDNASQGAGAGSAPVHKGNGYHSYSPTQSETNGEHVEFTFTGAGAITAGIQVYTNTPQSADNTILINALNDFDPAADAVANVTLVATTTENTDMKGTDNALLAAGYTAPDNTGIANILTDTGTTIPAQISGLNDFDPASDAVANVTLVATTTINTDMKGTDNALLAADINLTAGAVDNVTLVATTAVNTDMKGTDDALLAAGYTAPDNAGIAQNGTDIGNLNDFDPTAQMTESYAVAGVAPSMEEALFMIQQKGNVGDFTVAGADYIIKKLDGVTQAATYTLDDSGNPTGATRTS